jgi:iron complex outermembrane receptor protein
VDAVGAPRAAATISVQGATVLTVQSDEGGRFELRNLPDGEYDLIVTLHGFAPEHRRIHVTTGNEVSVVVTLSISVQEQTVVTAARTGERDVQSIPMAISVLSGQDLERVQARTVEHLAGLAPSVTFSQNTGFAQLTIRGIGTNVVFAGSDPSSAVYLDGVYLARPAMQLADMLDLERVEVLRGPQGTLYGRNAVGGAINLVTRPPANELEASARLVVGNFNSLRTEARVAGPIVRDKVFGSASFLRGVRDGTVRDLDNPDHPLGGEDVTAARGKVQVIFNPRSDLLVWGDVTHQDPTPLTYAKVLAVKPGFEVANPADLHEVRTSTPAWSRNLVYGAAARFTMRLAPQTTLTSLTSYRQLDYDVLADADITELELTASNIHEIHRQVSQEVTISQRRSGVTWIGGVFLFGDVDRQPTSVRLGGPRVENRLNPRVDTDTAAIFGHATLPITGRLSATAGLRYTNDRKTIVNEGQLYTLDLPTVALAGSAYAYTDSMTHTAWSPKAGLEMRAWESALAYVSASRGFKSGGFNPSSQQPGLGYHPEWAWSYEGGLKTDVAGGRGRLNMAAFVTDYTDLQVQTTIRPGVLDISNAAAATIRGIEVEGAIRLARRLHGGGHVAWLDARYDRYIAVGVGGITGDVAGRRLSNAPEWAGGFWLEWNSDVGSAGTWSLRADSRSQSTVYFTPFNDAIQRQRSYGLLDLSADFRARRWGISVGAYVRNLTNEDYITGTFSSPPPAIGGRPGDPRQAGIQLTIGRP